jgi:hypothetical protein
MGEHLNVLLKDLREEIKHTLFASVAFLQAIQSR